MLTSAEPQFPMSTSAERVTPMFVPVITFPNIATFPAESGGPPASCQLDALNQSPPLVGWFHEYV